MSDRMLNKVVIITGGASGIGEGMVQRFCAEGARVVLADVDTSRGRNRERTPTDDLTCTDSALRRQCRPQAIESPVSPDWSRQTAAGKWAAHCPARRQFLRGA